MWRNGSRTRLRIWRRKAWGFESLHPHHKAESPSVNSGGLSLYSAEASDEGILLQYLHPLSQWWVFLCLPVNLSYIWKFARMAKLANVAVSEAVGVITLGVQVSLRAR